MFTLVSISELRVLLLRGVCCRAHQGRYRCFNLRIESLVIERSSKISPIRKSQTGFNLRIESLVIESLGNLRGTRKAVWVSISELRVLLLRGTKHQHSRLILCCVSISELRVLLLRALSSRVQGTTPSFSFQSQN